MKKRNQYIYAFIALAVAFVVGCGKSEYRSPETQPTVNEPQAQTGVVDGTTPVVDNQPANNDPSTQPQQPVVLTQQLELIQQQFGTIAVSTLGDSVAVGFNSAGLFVPSYSNSWSTGTDINSHFTRIFGMVNGSGLNMSAHNYAWSGGRILQDNSSNLVSQAEVLADRIREEDYNYITIMAGGNDICQIETIDENFKANIKTELEETLALVGPYANLILMTTIPDIDQVVNELQCPVPNAYREFVLDYMCPNHDKLTSEEMRNRLDLLNDAIAEVARDSEYNVVFDDYLIYDTVVTNDQVSNLDCFHPTVQGQQDIADSLWPLVAPYFE